MKKKTISIILSLLLASTVLTACGNTASEISTGEGNAFTSASGKVIAATSAVMTESIPENELNAGKETILTKEEKLDEQKAAENAEAAIAEGITETTADASAQTASANKTDTAGQKTTTVSQNTAATNQKTTTANNATAAETKTFSILMPDELHEEMKNDKWYLRLDTTDATVIDRAMGEEVLTLVNAERASAGLNELAWDEELYDIAVQRCYENDGHDGVRANTGENAGYWQNASITTAQTCHNSWYKSTGHHDNYMAAFYTKGAVAFIKTKSGSIIGYEVFAGDSYGKNNTAAATGGITVTQGTLLEYHHHGTDPYSEYCTYCNPPAEQEAVQNDPVDTTSREYLLSDTAVFAGTPEEVQAMHDERERLQAEERERIQQEAEAEVRRMEQELGIKILDY